MLGMGISTPVGVWAGATGCDCAAAGIRLPAIKTMMARSIVTLNVSLFFKNASTGSRSAKINGAKELIILSGTEWVCMVFCGLSQQKSIAKRSAHLRFVAGHESVLNSEFRHPHPPPPVLVATMAGSEPGQFKTVSPSPLAWTKPPH